LVKSGTETGVAAALAAAFAAADAAAVLRTAGFLTEGFRAMVAALAAGFAATFVAALGAGDFAGVVMLLSCHFELSVQPMRDLLANEL
jgi:hypothetical protein